MAQLYVRGAKIDWAGFDRDYPRRKTELPAYPFQRRRYWSNGVDDMAHRGPLSPQRNGRVLHPLLGRRLAVAAKRADLRVADRRQSAGDAGRSPDPRAGADARRRLSGDASWLPRPRSHGKPWKVSGLTLIEPLLLDKTPKTIQTVVSPEGPDAASFRIVGMAQAADDDAAPSFVTLATGHLESPRDAAAETIDLAAQRGRFAGEPYDEAWRIEALRRSGLEPGPSFRWLVRHWVSETEGLAELRTAQDADQSDDYQVHPGLLDSGFQLLGGILPGAGEGIDAYVPMGVDQVQVYDRPQAATWCRALLRSLKGKVAVGDIQFTDDSGRVLVKLEGVRLAARAARLAGPLAGRAASRVELRVGLDGPTVGQPHRSKRLPSRDDGWSSTRPTALAPPWPSGWK